MKRRSMRWEPPRDILSLREAMGRLMEEGFVRAPRRFMEPILGHELALDVYDAGQTVVVKTAVPGVRAEDLDISVMGDTLTIKGEISPDAEIKKEQYIRQEIRYGEFSRSVTLPSGLEPGEAEASFQDGILTLTIPKAEEIRPKVIRVKAD